MGLRPNYIPRVPCKVLPPYGLNKAQAFTHKHGPKELFALKGGRTLDLILHKALGPSDSLLNPNPWGVSKNTNTTNKGNN